MGQIIAGDLKDISWNHSILGSGVLYVKADEESEVDLGGYRVNDDEKGVDTANRNIKGMSNNRWSTTATVSSDETLTKELSRLKALAAHPIDAVWTITHQDGTVWRGEGGPVGDVKKGLKAGTIALKLAGGGELKQIA